MHFVAKVVIWVVIFWDEVWTDNVLCDWGISAVVAEERVLEEMKTTIMTYISLTRIRGTPGPGVWFVWLGQEEEMKTTSIYLFILNIPTLR